jgi:hypothetical protein
MSMPQLPDIPVTEAVAATWGRSLKPAGCMQCQQVHLIDEARLGAVCPHCARDTLQPQPAFLRPEPPELLIPFSQQPASVQPIVDRFVRQVWLRPDDFNTAMLMQRMVAVYWPMWLVDGEVIGNWEAEVGYDYQVKSSQEHYSDGEWQSQEVIETRIRWEPRVGQMVRRYDNLAVPALSDHQELHRLIGSYQRERAVAYDPMLLDGADLRVPDVQPKEAWSAAQVQFARSAAAECQQASAADHIRSFALSADYEQLHWTQLLHPLFVTWYSDEDGTPHPITINGESGAIGGVRMASRRKGWKWAGILLAVAVVLFVLGVLFTFVQQRVSGMAVLGTIGSALVMLGSCVMLSAIIPAVWPLFWNSQQGKR